MRPPIERWKIWKRVGRWDDAILGPDTGTIQGDPGIVIGEGTEVVRASDYEGAVSLAEVCEFLRTATRWEPGSGRDRHINGWRAAADELDRHFGRQ